MQNSAEIETFQQTILDYYHQHQRNLLWRQPNADGTFDPYKIMVSEIMLQQTQVTRVTEKYRQFLEVFPTLADLAGAPLQEVLFLWQGLGYNRRARFLREAAIVVSQDYAGGMPQTAAALVRLPGIGPNTASAILVYAHNQPLVFIETNIRTTYIDYFFADQDNVTDKEILELVAQTLYADNPREWYWALMDYGTHLKSTKVNPSRRSKHHVVQSKFEGSARQVRGAVLRELATGPKDELLLQQTIKDDRFSGVIDSLIKDRLVARHGARLQIAD